MKSFHRKKQKYTQRFSGCNSFDRWEMSLITSNFSILVYQKEKTSSDSHKTLDLVYLVSKCEFVMVALSFIVNYFRKHRMRVPTGNF